MFSCVSLSMCSRISASSSSNMRLLRLMTRLLLRWPEDPCDRSRQSVPLAGLHLQLLPALARQPVKLGAPVVLRSAFFHGNPSSLDKPVQRRIERALFHLQHFVRIEFDGLRDGVPVLRPQQKRPENQQVQRALQQLDAFAFFFSRHSR